MWTTSTRRTLAGVAAAVVSGCLGLAMVQAHAANASPEAVAAPAARSVPPAIEVPPGQVLTGDFHAAGVQVYRCAAGAWTFVEPAANLLGWTKRPGHVATTVHFRGPSWESTDDGSLVEARVIASSPVPGSIPQLLLQATVNRGDGVFGHVSYVQRLATRGGAAPAGACTDGQTTGVRYRAEYRFFTPAS
ncbi:MAG TPA: DUF3455 domain-containing protein [Streptosporangiaceae bacterium]|jgi:hypothetical protein